jgi:hypothetical protein
MVENYLETGTPFDYADKDFGKIIRDLFKKYKGKNDKSSADDVPAIEVGEEDIPDRDNIYIDKTFEDED